MSKVSKISRISCIELPITKIEAERQAYANLGLINAEGSLQPLMRDFMDELGRDVLPRAKMNRLKKVASQISKVVTPNTACRSGCSHCCNIAAVITQTEADALAAASGRKAVKLGANVQLTETRDKWFRVPCPFLKKGRCSVYEDRPLVCRLMFNLADNPYFCNTDIPPKESHVTWLNLRQLEDGYMKAFFREPWGDIRDFFPS
jgi:Fe-S-cluster containining protein